MSRDIVEGIDVVSDASAAAVSPAVIVVVVVVVVVVLTTVLLRRHRKTQRGIRGRHADLTKTTTSDESDPKTIEVQQQYVSLKLLFFSISCVHPLFLDPEGGSQKAIPVVLPLVVVISSLKISKAFFIRSGAQRIFAHTFVLTLSTDLPSQIFHIFF